MHFHHMQSKIAALMEMLTLLERNWLTLPASKVTWQITFTMVAAVYLLMRIPRQTIVSYADNRILQKWLPCDF